MSLQEEQVNRLRNRHVAKLLTNLNEVGQLPRMTENEIKREFTFFANDVVEQVLSQHKLQGNTNDEHTEIRER